MSSLLRSGFALYGGRMVELKWNFKKPLKCLVAGTVGVWKSPPHPWHFCLRLRSSSAGSVLPQPATCLPSESVAAFITCQAKLLLGLQPQLLEVGGAQVPTATRTHCYQAWGCSLSPLANRRNFPLCSCALPLITCLSALWVQDSSETSYSGSHWYSCLVGSCQWGNWKAFAKETGRCFSCLPGYRDSVHIFAAVFHKQSCVLFSFSFSSLPFPPFLPPTWLRARHYRDRQNL